MISRTVILLAIVGFACAATWQGYVPKKPSHLADKEGCYVEEIKDVIPYGAMITPKGHCYRVECSGGMLYYASCGIVMSGSPDCFVTNEDLNKPYPECCPTVKCEEENQLI